jgi:hypothetical protein
MTELMRMLPKDLQREVWSFIGMKSFGISPTAEILKDYIADMYYNCSIIPDEALYFDNNKLNLNYNYSDDIIFCLGISRMYYIFKTLFQRNKALYNGNQYKHIDTEEGSGLADWCSDPRCEDCEYPLSLEEFQHIVKNNKFNYCNNCYGINNGMIGDEDAVDECCNNCDKMLVGYEWKIIMNKSSEFAGMCGRCIEIHEDDDDADEEEEE